jgi:hypothetical protein
MIRKCDNQVTIQHTSRSEADIARLACNKGFVVSKGLKGRVRVYRPSRDLGWLSGGRIWGVATVDELHLAWYLFEVLLSVLLVLVQLM